MSGINPVSLLIKKRDGLALSAAEIGAFIAAFMDGEVTDYQMSAFLMAALLNGMNADETVALTQAMLHSGTVLTLPSVPGYKIDKHSTGGIGDKISICLAPIVAAAGAYVPMISGRGLGHTGGTLDKLESITGYDTRLSVADFERVVRETGASVIGQTAELAPADRRIYGLRDVTGTVESIPLIVASILSKKLAEGIDGLVLDVKVGRGAFMKTPAKARALARALVKVGRGAGKDVIALLTNMNVPLGRTIGNALEVREAIEVVHGGGPTDVRELTLTLAAEMLVQAKVAKNARAARRLAEEKVASGEAADHLARMIAAQGGDARVVVDTSLLPHAPHQGHVFAQRSGYVSDIDPMVLGLLIIDLGGGRTRADQKVDPAVGIELLVQQGAAVKQGQPIAIVHARQAEHLSPAVAQVASAFKLGPGKPKLKALVGERITR